MITVNLLSWEYILLSLLLFTSDYSKTFFSDINIRWQFFILFPIIFKFVRINFQKEMPWSKSFFSSFIVNSVFKYKISGMENNKLQAYVRFLHIFHPQWNLIIQILSSELFDNMYIQIQLYSYVDRKSKLDVKIYLVFSNLYKKLIPNQKRKILKKMNPIFFWFQNPLVNGCRGFISPQDLWL